MCNRGVWAHTRAAQMGFSVATLLAVLLTPSGALAGEELIVRKSVGFEHCKTTTLALPAALKADPDHVHVVRDTGAEFRLKIVSVEANLLIGCNKVSDQMEVYRTTPGEAPGGRTEVVAGADSSAS
ncbi:MAG: hypothetical protein AAFY73_02770 [Pseudomonadota bacterium]